MRKRILDVLCAILAVTGYVLIIGTAGAIDCETICLSDAISRCAIGFGLIAGAFVTEIVREY